MVRGNRDYCDWCDKIINSIVMLHIDLWAQISEGRISDVMCQECIINKLGHTPTEHDCRRPWWQHQLPNQQNQP